VKTIPETSLRTAVVPHVVEVICEHHLEFDENDKTVEALITFLQGYAKAYLKGIDDWWRALVSGVRHLMNLKHFDRVDNLMCQLKKVIQR